ncbi:PREDICTED: uncharacterized protein LOC105364207 [Ceratosolen solmsi marchali]|uniref:Uncharacterized protein LOC105364207 n=1 Tax=Ceratosolen solmsi marchali TaxID=326594 RepID=A0AAJ6YLS7_9HYME|nr:PREDICTED: uncharacterized protein LOC105364207 [Ceratosolen solmsi marchali]
MVVSDDMTLNINLKKPIAVVSEKFLSITLDPVSLFNSNSLSDVEKTTSMAKALAPAYVRIGGPRSNSYIFERGLYPKELQLDPGYTFSEKHWIQVHQWAESSGLDIIACLAPQQSESSNNGNNARTSFWDPRNALDLISFSDHMGYNISWQLGYECQTRCDVRGAELGRDVQRLRNMLDAFPRYAERGMIVGPDVVTYKTRQQQQYLQDYFNAASGSLSAVTWHPDFASISLEADGVSMHYDNLAFDKDAFYRAAGRHISKKPLWIAESRPEECKQQFLGALVWARRLGNSAKLGLQVIMRQPDNSNPFRSTPDYWVSILHKMLVGREVLDTKITTGNRTHVHFYSQCTNPSSKYEKGSLTVFGINLTPSKITASLKGIKLKVIHKYILLPGYDAPNRMFSETVLLNNEPLNLIDEKEVPDVQPAISNAEKGVKLKLPSGGIGFWVLPGLKVKSCMGHVDEIPDKNPLRKINRRFEESDGDIDSTSEDENNRETTDVNSVEERKPSLRLQRTTQKRLTLRKNIRHKEEERDDLDERKLRKLDGARHDFDRLENIMRKKDQHTVNLKSGGTHGVFENSGEEDNGSSEEGVFRKTVNEQKVDSGEVIRAKLQEYKNQLSNYESRKKQREILSNLPKDRFKDGQDESINKVRIGMNTEKVIEALTLITKVESAMKGLEKENENEVQITSETPPTLGIDRSLRRRKRDVDKRLGDDPLSLLHDNIFLRKRIKTEEAKERLIERVNERKQRLRERQEQKREKEDLKKESRDSNENNFYGFQHGEPLKNFPEGDVYFQTEINTNKNKGINCDYNDDDNINKEMYKNWKRSNIPTDMDEYKNLWFDESGETKHMPTDFFENLKLQTLNSKENFKNYGELWEIESFHKNETNDKKQNESDESENHEIVTEISLRDSENHKTEERAAQQLINFYKMDINEKNYDLDDLKFNQKEIQSQLFPLIIIPNNPKISTGNDNFNLEQHNRYINTDRYHDNLNKGIQPSESLYHRTKRYLNDLEDLLHQEMITQDNNNLKDCQCRVIRGIEECKDCDLNSRNFIGTQLISIPNQAIDNYNTKIRIQRDLNKETNTDYLEETIDSGADSDKIEIMNSERPTNPKKSSYIKNEEPNFENYNKTDEILVPTIIKVEDELSTKNINDKTWNRLPRKIESSAKFLLKSEENLTKPAININSQVNQQKNSDINDFSVINAYIPTNETETAIEHHKIKPKNNSAIKIDERIKSRQARLTTRAEALTALKKENESRRAKKMIEASMKIIDMEKSKFAEYQKRRYDQIERLKRKLRAKREKMLQQYRSELLEVINDNSESKESNIHRRDLFNHFQTASHDTTTNDMITNPNEFDYSINSNPIKYSSEKDTYKSKSEKFLPAFEMLEPFRDVHSKQALPKFQTKIYIDDDNSKMQIIKDKKQKTSPKKHLKNEDAYNINHEEKFRIKNNKRFPYALTEASNNQNNLTIQQNSSSTIQTNIGSILIDSIPKLQTVITGGLKKAENLTGSLENFIDNYDNQLNNTRKRLKDNSGDINTFEVNNERLNHNIFKTMIGSVKKFFGIVSGIAKIFHVH